MTARNDITGDPIVNSKGNHAKYAENWEKIFGKKQPKTEDQSSKEEGNPTEARRPKGRCR